jgi:hemin uptake protein HemP
MSDEKPTPESDRLPVVEPVVRSADLFGERKEIVIEHDGERYRLRITRRGKLILQK